MCVKERRLESWFVPGKRGPPSFCSTAHGAASLAPPIRPTAALLIPNPSLPYQNPPEKPLNQNPSLNMTTD